MATKPANKNKTDEVVSPNEEMADSWGEEATHTPDTDAPVQPEAFLTQPGAPHITHDAPSGNTTAGTSAQLGVTTARNRSRRTADQKWVKALVARGMASYDSGDNLEAIDLLNRAIDILNKA